MALSGERIAHEIRELIIERKLRAPEGDEKIESWWQRQFPGHYPRQIVGMLTREIPNGVLTINTTMSYLECIGPGISDILVHLNTPAQQLKLESLYLKKNAQGKSIGRQFLHNLAEMASLYNFPAISISTEEIGSYVWAKCGFKPSPSSWKAIVPHIEARLEEVKPSLDDTTYQTVKRCLASEDPRAIWDLAEQAALVKTPAVLQSLVKPEENQSISLGKALLIAPSRYLNCRWGWAGALDLTDEKEAMPRFNAYAGRGQTPMIAVAAKAGQSAAGVSP